MLYLLIYKENTGIHLAFHPDRINKYIDSFILPLMMSRRFDYYYSPPRASSASSAPPGFEYFRKKRKARRGDCCFPGEA